jgi:hypothetical protein
MNSYKRTDLQKMDNNVQFETTFQFMKPPSPLLPAGRVLFPPPKKRLKNINSSQEIGIGNKIKPNYPLLVSDIPAHRYPF